VCLHKNGPRWTALVVLLLIEKRLAAAERQQAARGLLCMRVVGFRIQVLLNPSSLSLYLSIYRAAAVAFILSASRRPAEQDNPRERCSSERVL